MKYAHYILYQLFRRHSFRNCNWIRCANVFPFHFYFFPKRGRDKRAISISKRRSFLQLRNCLRLFLLRLCSLPVAMFQCVKANQIRKTGFKCSVQCFWTNKKLSSSITPREGARAHTHARTSANNNGDTMYTAELLPHTDSSHYARNSSFFNNFWKLNYLEGRKKREGTFTCDKHQERIKKVSFWTNETLEQTGNVAKRERENRKNWMTFISLLKLRMKITKKRQLTFPFWLRRE